MEKSFRTNLQVGMQQNPVKKNELFHDRSKIKEISNDVYRGKILVLPQHNTKLTASKGF